MKVNRFIWYWIRKHCPSDKSISQTVSDLMRCTLLLCWCCPAMSRVNGAGRRERRGRRWRMREHGTFWFVMRTQPPWPSLTSGLMWSVGKRCCTGEYICIIFCAVPMEDDAIGFSIKSKMKTHKMNQLTRLLTCILFKVPPFCSEFGQWRDVY